MNDDSKVYSPGDPAGMIEERIALRDMSDAMLQECLNLFAQCLTLAHEGELCAEHQLPDEALKEFIAKLEAHQVEYTAEQNRRRS